MTPIDTDDERERQVAAIKRNRRIPYGDIALAVQIGKKRFPEAAKVTGRIYANTPYIEVWDVKGAAVIYFVDVDAGEVLERSAPRPKARSRGRASRSKAERPSATLA